MISRKMNEWMNEWNEITDNDDDHDYDHDHLRLSFHSRFDMIWFYDQIQWFCHWIFVFVAMHMPILEKKKSKK